MSNSHITQQSKFIHPASTNCLIVLKNNTSFDTRSLLGTHHTHLYLPVKSEALLSSLTNNTDEYAETHPLSEKTTFHYLLRHSFIPVSFIQTLTTLDLAHNQIGDQGAQYLGEALRHNTVRSSLLHVFIIISFLSLSYRHSLHSTCRTIKLEIKVHNIWVKHSNTRQWDHHFFMFLSSSHSCLFHTDTHYTRP